MTLENLIVLWIVASSEAFLLQGPSGPLTAQLGGSVLLPCSVETPLPLEELEVEWRRTDSDVLVHLFQEGEERPESQDYAYRGRAHFFNEPIMGNYSLVLTNVTLEDAGVYMCKVYTNLDSNEVTAQIKSIEHFELTGSGALSAYVSETVTLNCTVDTHIQSELLQVTWKRTEQEMIVLSFQNGQILNSSHERYRGRAEFFPSEIPKGNFSLRLKDVRPEDIGEYVCEAHSGQLSGKTTTMLKGLGVHHVIILALILCFLALVSTVGLGIPECINLTKNDSPDSVQSDSASTTVSQQEYIRRDMLIRYSLVLCPNIMMFTAFLLCGVTDGFVGEIVTCSTVNLSRFLLLFKSAPYLKPAPYFPERLEKLVKHLSIPIDYIITAGALYSGVFKKMSNLNINPVFLGFTLGMVPIFSAIFLLDQNYRNGYWTFIFLDIFNWVLMWLLVIGTPSFDLDMFAVTLAVTLMVHILFWMQEKCEKGVKPASQMGITLPFLDWNLLYPFWTFFLAVAFPSYTVLYLAYIGEILKEKRECAGLMCGTALLHILTAISGFKHPVKHPDLKTFHIILYMFGAAGLPIVNCIALATDLLFKSYEGKRRIADLQVIVLPSECIFVFGWLVFQIHDFWTRERNRLKKQLQRACSFNRKDRGTNSQDDHTAPEMVPLQVQDGTSTRSRHHVVAEEQTES